MPTSPSSHLRYFVRASVTAPAVITIGKAYSRYLDQSHPIRQLPKTGTSHHPSRRTGALRQLATANGHHAPSDMANALPGQSRPSSLMRVCKISERTAPQELEYSTEG